jgi:hypothetical protein
MPFIETAQQLQEHLPASPIYTPALQTADQQQQDRTIYTTVAPSASERTSPTSETVHPAVLQEQFLKLQKPIHIFQE